MRSYDVERSYLAGGVPDTSLLQEQRRDAEDAAKPLGESTWCLKTMEMINHLTPDIKEKSFDPDWFLLRQWLEEAGKIVDLHGIAEANQAFPKCKDGDCLDTYTETVMWCDWCRERYGDGDN